MKAEIHPEYQDTAISCACGATFKTKSTKQNLRVEICSQCHPFYTGKQKLIDSAGRVDKFKKRFAKKQKLEADKQKKADAAAESNE